MYSLYTQNHFKNKDQSAIGRQPRYIQLKTTNCKSALKKQPGHMKSKFALHREPLQSLPSESKMGRGRVGERGGAWGEKRA
jgi:hypothetical protein